MKIKENEIFEGERLYLRIPTLADETLVMDFRQEFIEQNSYFAGVNSLADYDDYADWLEHVEKNADKKTLAPDRCQDTQFLTFEKSSNRLVGMIDIRHTLNDYLFKFGGHIGDCIRPSDRGKGYATEQIGIALKVCKKLKIEKVLITCEESNLASAKTIEKNGGIYENSLKKDEKVYRRYWVDTTKITD